MRIRKTWLFAVALILVGVYFASGIYLVAPDERAVVRWFGHIPEAYRKVPPGIHYAPPWPVCRVDLLKTKEVRRVYVGLTPAQRQAITDGDTQAMLGSYASDMLTGDVNILKATMVVQYQICDPVQYLFGGDDMDRLTQRTVQGVLLEVLAATPVDELLTTAKASLQTETLARAQTRLDGYGCGVRLVATHLESIEPPRAVIAAFQEVVSAKKDGEKAVDRAVAEANRILPNARGNAAKLREEAQAYRQERISRARGEADRFASILVEYRKSPAVFKQRVLLQTLETVLPKLRTYVLDEKPGDPPTTLKLIERARVGP